MTAAESSRSVLYTGLTEKLGQDLADRLMTFLPSSEISNLATKDDIARLEAALSETKSDLAEMRSDLAQTRAETKVEIAQLGFSLTRDLSQASTRILLAVLGVFATGLAGMAAVVFN